MYHLKILLSALAMTLSVGCANDYYTSYKETHEGWSGAFPARNVSLHEVLARLQQPRSGEPVVLLTRLDVSKQEDGLFENLSQRETAAAVEHPPEVLVVAATQFCRATLGKDLPFSEKTSVFVFEQGQLVAYDASLFAGTGCEVRREVRGDQSRLASLERRGF